MNWKKGLIAGVALTVLSMVWSMLAGLLNPSYALEMQNAKLFRPFSDPLMTVFFLSPFILGFTLLYFWNLVQEKITGKTEWEKAAGFGKMYFIVGTIPGMFITYTSMQVSLYAILVWSAMGFLEAVTAAVVYQKVK